MRRLFAPLLIALALLGGIVTSKAPPAFASECNVIPAMHLYTLSNGESGCAKIVVTHIRSQPGKFWLSWWVQDVTDWGSDADNTSLGFRWSANSNGGFLGSDIWSSDYNVNSGYALRTIPVGVNIDNIRGTLTIHGTTVTNSMPIQVEWVN